MTLGATFDAGARVRAARAAAGLSRHTLAEATAISASVLARIELGVRDASRRDLEDIADACGVPGWFLAAGWEGWHESADFRIRMESARHRVGTPGG